MDTVKGMCYIFLGYFMTSRDEAEIGEFFNLGGDLFSPTLQADWIRPESVDLLSGGTLKIREPFLPYPTRETWYSIDRGMLVKAHPALLERFLALSDATNERTCEFARRYGRLGVFGLPVPVRSAGIRTLPREHLEHCDVWRYFSRAMLALLKAASKLNREEAVLAENWSAVGVTPLAMRQTRKTARHLTSNEENWLATISACQRRASSRAVHDKALVVSVLNSLLGLAEVRPWLTWPGSIRSHARPQMAYSGRSLLSNLTLQLCLRVSRIDAFLVCVHCQAQYIPKVRAPKTGQRNFCPACRDAGVPKNYALKDFRERQRRSRDAKKAR